LSLWSPPRNPTIASRATPIGSADRAPDEKERRREKILKIVYAGHDEERQNKERVLLSLYPKKMTIASGASPIGSASRAPNEDEIINLAIKKGNYGVHNGANYWLHCQQINIRHWYSLIHSHWEGFTSSQRKQPKYCGYWNSQTRLTTKLWFSSRVIVIKSLNAMIVKDHEGKT
jgi:hypothetical protein